MASIINIGKFRARVTLSYLSGQTTTDMGSRTPTYTTKIVWADVSPLTFEYMQRNNLNFEDENYTLICRDYGLGKIVKVEYDDEYYTVISQEKDKYSKFIKMLINRKA